MQQIFQFICRINANSKTDCPNVEYQTFCINKFISIFGIIHWILKRTINLSFESRITDSNRNKSKKLRWICWNTKMQMIDSFQVDSCSWAINLIKTNFWWYLWKMQHAINYVFRFYLKIKRRSQGRREYHISFIISSLVHYIQNVCKRFANHSAHQP